MASSQTWTSPRRSRNADLIAVRRDERRTLPTLWNRVWCVAARSADAGGHAARGDPRLTWTPRLGGDPALRRALLRRPSPPPADATLAWQLRVWDPKPASKQLFLYAAVVCPRAAGCVAALAQARRPPAFAMHRGRRFYSPAHAVALMVADRPAHLVTLVAISCALWWLDTFYAQQAWDRQLLFDEVYGIQLAVAADRPARPEWKVYWQSPQAQRHKPQDDEAAPAAHDGDEAGGHDDAPAETPTRIRRRHH